MTTDVDIVNRSLAAIGTRTTVASFLENSNEAKQANLLYGSLRDELIRLAPWNCTTNYAVLQLITAAPGTPENASNVGTIVWNKTIPAPPWAYEYAYPSDCLKALFIIPQFQTGFASGIPITTAVTGGAPNFWNGPPVRFRVAVDQPTTVGGIVVVNAGVNYAVNDIISIAGGIGVPAQLIVTAIGAGGSITGISSFIGGSYSTTPANPVSQNTTSGSGSGATFTLSYLSTVSAAAIAGGGVGYAVGDSITLTGGSTNRAAQLTVASVAAGVITGVSILLGGVYFGNLPANPIAQGSTTGSGLGATFNLTFSTTFDQRVILTNQENAVLAYCKRVTDPNQWDSQFQQAMIAGLAARLANPLTGDDKKAQTKLNEANAFIIEARKSDANEGLTVNDVTPDWIRIRGIDFAFDPAWDGSPSGLDWGPLLSLY